MMDNNQKDLSQTNENNSMNDRMDAEKISEDSHVHRMNVAANTQDGEVNLAFEGDNADQDNRINDNYYNAEQHSQALKNVHNENNESAVDINIPNDSVINMNNGRTKNKNKKNKDNEVEKIPLDDMDDTVAFVHNDQMQTDFLNKPDNEHNTNGHGNGVPVTSDNLTQNKPNNSMNKPFKEYFIPVTTHKKFLRGEKLYLQKYKGKSSSWKKCIICGIITTFLAIAILIAILLATGLIVLKSDDKEMQTMNRTSGVEPAASRDKNTEGMVVPIDEPIPITSTEFYDPVTENIFTTDFTTDNLYELTSTTESPTPFNPYESSTFEVTEGSVNEASPSTTLDSVATDSSVKTRLIDSDDSNAVSGEIKLTDLKYDNNLSDNTSSEFQTLARSVEQELANALSKDDKKIKAIKVIGFSPGSVNVHYVIIYEDEQSEKSPEETADALNNYITENGGVVGGHAVDPSSIKVEKVQNKCLVDNGLCSHFCYWDTSKLEKICSCSEGYELDSDDMNCIELLEESTTEILEPSSEPEPTSTDNYHMFNVQEPTAYPELISENETQSTLEPTDQPEMHIFYDSGSSSNESEPTPEPSSVHSNVTYSTELYETSSHFDNFENFTDFHDEVSVAEPNTFHNQTEDEMEIHIQNETSSTEQNESYNVTTVLSEDQTSMTPIMDEDLIHQNDSSNVTSIFDEKIMESEVKSNITNFSNGTFEMKNLNDTSDSGDGSISFFNETLEESDEKSINQTIYNNTEPIHIDNLVNVTEIFDLLEVNSTSDEMNTTMNRNISDEFDFSNETMIMVNGTSENNNGTEYEEDHLISNATSTQNSTASDEESGKSLTDVIFFQNNATCLSNQYTCLKLGMENVSCIPSSAKCDGIADCEDGSDEKNCDICSVGTFPCKDKSYCLSPVEICDSVMNCADRSDEKNCVQPESCASKGGFYCPSGFCLPGALRCNGISDCLLGEDEESCSCSDQEFQCSNKMCIPWENKCDGINQCADGLDELDCVKIEEQSHEVKVLVSQIGWLPLCGDKWTIDDGHAVCQQLGYNYADSVGTDYSDTREWAIKVGLAPFGTEIHTAVAQSSTCDSSSDATLHCAMNECKLNPGLNWDFLVLMLDDETRESCQGILISSMWILTTKSCVDSRKWQPNQKLTVNTGVADNAINSQTAKIDKIIHHPNENMWYTKGLIQDQDVTLIKLQPHLKLQTGASCPIFSKNMPTSISKCIAGVIRDEKFETNVMKIHNMESCNSSAHYNGLLTSAMICAHNESSKKDCASNGPSILMCKEEENWKISGILSYERLCDLYNPHPKIFSNLASTTSFIQAIIGKTTKLYLDAENDRQFINEAFDELEFSLENALRKIQDSMDNKTVIQNDEMSNDTITANSTIDDMIKGTMDIGNDTITANSTIDDMIKDTMDIGNDTITANATIDDILKDTMNIGNDTITVNATIDDMINGTMNMENNTDGNYTTTTELTSVRNDSVENVSSIDGMNMTEEIFNSTVIGDSANETYSMEESSTSEMIDLNATSSLSNVSASNITINGSCAITQFTCEFKFECVDASKLCDGNEDCADGSDEMTCLRLHPEASVLEIRKMGVKIDDQIIHPREKWVPICTDHWTEEMNDIACKQMGFSGALSASFGSSVSLKESRPSQRFKTLSPSFNTSTAINIQSMVIDTEECNSGNYTTLTCKPSKCGSWSLDLQPVGRTVGGNPAQDGQWPSISILKSKANDSIICTANILNKKWILTAASCLDKLNMDPKSWVFQAAPSSSSVNVDKIIIHPDMRVDDLNNNDLALVQLSEFIHDDSKVHSICIPFIPLEDRQLCVTASWMKNPENQELTLKYLPVPIVPMSECNGTVYYDGQLSNDMICAGFTDRPRISCEGDEGAPLMCFNGQGLWVLHGTLLKDNVRPGCSSENIPSVYSKIYESNHWISQILSYTNINPLPY